MPKEISISRWSGTTIGAGVSLKAAWTRSMVSRVRLSGETYQSNSSELRPERWSSRFSSWPLRSAWARPVSLSGMSLRALIAALGIPVGFAVADEIELGPVEVGHQVAGAGAAAGFVVDEHADDVEAASTYWIWPVTPEARSESR